MSRSAQFVDLFITVAVCQIYVMSAHQWTQSNSDFMSEEDVLDHTEKIEKSEMVSVILLSVVKKCAL